MSYLSQTNPFTFSLPESLYLICRAYDEGILGFQNEMEACQYFIKGTHTVCAIGAIFMENHIRGPDVINGEPLSCLVKEGYVNGTEACLVRLGDVQRLHDNLCSDIRRGPDTLPAFLSAINYNAEHDYREPFSSEQSNG